MLKVNVHLDYFNFQILVTITNYRINIIVMALIHYILDIKIPYFIIDQFLQALEDQPYLNQLKANYMHKLNQRLSYYLEKLMDSYFNFRVYKIPVFRRNY